MENDQSIPGHSALELICKELGQVFDLYISVGDVLKASEGLSKDPSSCDPAVAAYYRDTARNMKSISADLLAEAGSKIRDINI